MLVNGRDINCWMYKNDGVSDWAIPPTSIDITPYIKKDGISKLSKQLDQVFKLDLSTLSLDCKNTDGSLWTFIDTNLSITGGIFPPWIVLTVDQKPYFLGLVDLESLTRDCKNETIKISAQDWSKQLSSVFLTGSDWERTLGIIDSPVGAATYTCRSAAKVLIDNAYSVCAEFGDPQFVPARANNKIYFDNISVDIHTHMGIEFPDLYPGKTFVVSKVQVVDYVNPIYTGYNNLWVFWNYTEAREQAYTKIQQLEVTLEDGFAWPKQEPVWQIATSYGGGDRLSTTVNVTATDTTLGVSSYEEVLQDYPIGKDDIVHRVRIGFNGSGSVSMMNRIQVGDRISITLTDQSLQETEIIAVDYFTKEYVLKDNLSGPVYKGARVYLNSDDLKTLYYRNAEDLITNAMSNVADVYFDKFQKPSLTKYIFSALGSPMDQGEPTVVTNINGTVQSGSLQLRAMKNIGTSLPVGFWSIDDEDVYTKHSEAADATYLMAEDTINWTDQLLSAPAQFMTNEGVTINPDARLSNRNYMDWHCTVDNGIGLFTAGTADYLTSGYVYDYSTLRRWVFNMYSDSFGYQTFNAGTYGTVLSHGSTGQALGQTIFSIDIFPAIACSLGTGHSLISTDYEGNLRVHCGTTSVMLHNPTFARGIIRNTPYGTYVITKIGVGLIKWNGANLIVDFCKISTDDLSNTLTLLPNMFAHINATSNYIVGIFTTKLEDGTIATEARLLELMADPDTDPTTTILNKDQAGDAGERVFGFVSSMGRMVHDPYGSRILIIYDGRLYQISSRTGLIIERVKVDGMNALELIEYICQILGAMAVPNPRGYLEIISVNYLPPTVVNVPVGVVDKSQSRLNKYFFSVIRVNGYNDSVYADATGQVGTQTFEISSHPLLFTESQCSAVAETLNSFFGVPRREETHLWKCLTGTNPFDDLQLFQTVTINGVAKQWYLTGLTLDIINQKANATLLEKFPPEA